jgi:transposase
LRPIVVDAAVGEWLREDHLVWTILAAVETMDLRRFREAYRSGAAGRPPYDPAVMVSLLFYAYARGIRSWSQI